MFHYDRIAASVWPVIATHWREKNRPDDRKIFTMLQSLRVFLHFRLQFVVLFSVIASSWWTMNDFGCSSIFVKSFQASTSYKKLLMPNPFAKSWHMMRFLKKFCCKIIFHFLKISEKFFAKNHFLQFFWQNHFFSIFLYFFGSNSFLEFWKILLHNDVFQIMKKLSKIFKRWPKRFLCEKIFFVYWTTYLGGKIWRKKRILEKNYFSEKGNVSGNQCSHTYTSP